ncbi:uncharacterized protein LOC115470099 isoform X2 [Microcaecilia unicolor]|uniref:RNA/RNP complex-1-interacting phosphatase n=1 Tax=Microcaecilia unicolor TaxID=1415580 RepID=A0A6P7Y6W5_9AMPH|nr:uncharacterized protein LOC115470099 isoform X2 [Microcaecilia unicolor]
MVKKNSVPNGWRTVKPIGQRITGTRFIAFKVPLKGMANQRLTPTQKFTPKDLITEIKAQNEDLGLIIDLSNTTRYYNTKDLPKNVEYKKLCTAGLEVPDDDTILQFKRLVSTFLFENIGNEKLIGVHCTNGVSRTGYLICRYLIDVDCWDPEKAIQAFGEARGHQMEGSVYLSDLRNGPMRSNLGIYAENAKPDTNEEPAQCPQNNNFYRPEQRSSIHGRRINNNLKSEVSDSKFHNIPGRKPRPFLENESHDFRTEAEDFFDSCSGSRQRPVHGHQSHDFQGDRQKEDYFSSREPEQRRPSFRGPPSDRPVEDYKFQDRGYGQRQSFHDSPSPDFHSDRRMKDCDFPISGYGQRELPIHGPPSRRFPSNRQMDDFDFPNSGPEQRQHNIPSRDFLPDREMEDCKYPSNGSGQRRSFHDSLARGLPDRQMGDFDFPNSGPRQRQPFLGPPSHGFSPDRQMEDSDLRSSGPDFRPDRQMKGYDFTNSGPGQRRSNTPSRGIPYDGEMDDRDYPNSGPRQRRPFHNPPSRGLSPDRQMADTDFRKIGSGQSQPPYDGPPSQSFPLNRERDDYEFPNHEPVSHRFSSDRQMKDRDFSDFVPGQRASPFCDHSARNFQSDRLMEDRDFRSSDQRQPPFRGPPSLDFRPDRQMEDRDYANSRPRQRQPFFDGPPSHSFTADREMEDYTFPNRERGQRPPSFQGTPSPGFRPNKQIEESHFPNSGPEQRNPQFRGPQSSGFQSDKPVEEFDFPNSGSVQRQPFHGSPSHVFRPECQMQGSSFPNRRPGERQLNRPFQLDREMQDSVFTHSGHEQTRQPFCDPPLERQVEDRNFAKPGPEERYFPSSYSSKADTQMEAEDFFNRSRRLHSLHGPQSHDLKLENSPRSNPRKRMEEVCDFINERPQQNSESFKINQCKKDVSTEWQSERERPSHSGPIKRRHPSDDFNRGDKRFTPYASSIHPSHPSMSEKQHFRDCEKMSSSSGVLMESDKCNHVPVFSYDYNFGLPNHPPHKEDKDYNRSAIKSNQKTNSRKI